MAEALTRQPSNKRNRRHKALDPRERELKRLKLSVCDDVGFRLYLATYDQPWQRDELIERIVKEAEAGKVRVTRLDLGEAAPETNLIGLLRGHLASTDLPDGLRQAVMVTGIEQRLDYSAESEGFAFLRQANLLRDALPEAAPVPVVLWLSRMASAVLPAEAPDLWHWRAANFDFTGDEAPRVELLRELTRLKPEDDLGLTAEQRRARIRMLEDLLAELEREGPPKSKRQAAERAAILVDLGIDAGHLSLPAEALRHVEPALAIYRELGFQPGEALALRVLAGAWKQLGDPRRAIQLYEQCLAIEREVGDRRYEVAALHNLGSTWADLGETRQAIEYFEQALAIAREIGDRRNEHIALSNLSDAYYSQGELLRAIEYREQEFVIARETDDRRSQGKALGTLGLAYADLGEPRRAMQFFEHALAIAREIDDRLSEGIILANLGFAYRDLGEPQRAIEYLEQALAILRESSDQTLVGGTLSALGRVYRGLDEPRRAMEYYCEALRITRETRDRMGEGWTLVRLGEVYCDLGERQRAKDAVREALAIAEDIGVENLADAARSQLAEAAAANPS